MRSQSSTLPLPAWAPRVPASLLAWLDGGRREARGVLNSYGLVLFGVTGWPAVVLLAATFLQPERGIFGLLGAVIARRLAQWFAPATQAADLDWLGCNGLLVGLMLPLVFAPEPALAGLVVVAVVGTVLFAAAVRPAMERSLAVPLLSLPFVIAGWLAILAGRRVEALHPLREAVAVAPAWLPDLAVAWLRSLGAVFLQPSVEAGALVLVALAWWSRWAVVLAALGFVAAWGTYAAVGGPRGDLEQHLLGFNAVVCALATGGVFVVLSRASLVLAAVAAALATALGAALLTALQGLALPVLAAPFVAVTDAVLLALVHRVGGGPLQLVRGTPGRPEDALAQVLAQARRYPAAGMPLLYLPVLGRWQVSQGPAGPWTHQGLWSHAWDFEVADDAGRRWRNGGTALTDYYAYGAPVVAPADGRVVRAVGHLDDNPIGQVDTSHNWGNALVIAHAGGLHSALCHLQRGSLAVREGEQVVRGQVLARVGNSGRSPLPHLHVQLQVGAEVGAPTVAGEFLQYVRSAPTGRRYITHGCPQTGDTVEPLPIDDTVRACLALPAGRRWHWRIEGEGMPASEVWLSAIDPHGRRTLRGSDAVASIYQDDAYLTVLEYRGPGPRLLALFALAAARVPFALDPALRWQDSPSLLPLLPPLGRGVAELLLPFADRGAARTESRLTTVGNAVVVVTQLAPQAGLPDRIELTLRPQLGPVALRAWRGESLVMQAAVDADGAGDPP